MSQKTENDNIVFFEQDSPQAVESLKKAVSNAGELPMLGLVLKVEKDRVVNWMFADASFIKSLALVLPGKKKK